MQAGNDFFSKKNQRYADLPRWETERTENIEPFSNFSGKHA